MPVLNLEITSRQNEALEAMAEQLDETKSGVFRKALALLSLALRERSEGNSLGVVKDGELIKELLVFG